MIKKVVLKKQNDAPSETSTVRDYFAASALPIAWEIEKSSPTGAYSGRMVPSYDGAATRAYHLADAMLKARKP